MNIDKMTLEDFFNLPARKNNETIACDSIVILPSKSKTDLHDSGYRYIDFVAVIGSKPICRLSGYSDVIHLDGIGGFGYDWQQRRTGGNIPKTIEPSGWNMDCLPESGLMHLWANGRLICEPAYSSFEVFVSHDKR